LKEIRLDRLLEALSKPFVIKTKGRTKMINKIEKVRKALYISKAQYWCIQYLKAVTNKNASKIVEAGLKHSLKRIGKEKGKARKPKMPAERIRLDLQITKETIKALETLRVSQDLLEWSYNDFGRYGLKHILPEYKQRFPEMEKILNKYK
jgi:short subunit dehydrogenase-like uncharacterized protein